MRVEEIVFSVSMAAQLSVVDLPALDELRARLQALPDDASPRERAALHLAAAIVRQDRDRIGTRSAIEEARQAVELLTAERAEGGPELAAARHHLGRLLLSLAVGDPAEPPHLGFLAEARHFLERSRLDFEARGDLEALALSAVEMAHVLEREERISDALGLLNEELLRTPPATRGLLRITKVTLGLMHPGFEDEADATLATFLTEDARTAEDEGEVIPILGMFHRQLSPATRKLALSWLETRQDPPIDLLIFLRSGIRPNAPDTWFRPEERSRLERELGDDRTPARRRWKTAHTLLSTLPETERDLRLRCLDLLEEAIVSPELHPLERTAYQHDIGVGYKVLAGGDRRMAARAVEHLKAVVEKVQPWERADAAVNLARAHAALLKIDAIVSSTTLLRHVRHIEDVLGVLPPTERDRSRDPLIMAASGLLRLHELTHPACLNEARRILRNVLSEHPGDGDGLRFTYLAAWCAHVQGRGAASAVEVARLAAEKAGPVPEVRLKVPKGESIEHFATLVRVLAGTEPPERAAPSLLAQVAVFRPDAADLLLDVVETNARVGFGDGPTPHEWLQTTARALQYSPPEDISTRARRTAALVVLLAPRLTASQLRRAVDALRGPIGTEVERALEESNIPLEREPPEAAASLPLQERVHAMKGRALDLFKEAHESDDTAGAIALFDEARQLLDAAAQLAVSLDLDEQASLLASAGNARRHLARLQPDRASALLDEAIALYRKALPWTSEGLEGRAQISKILAETLITRGVASDWDEAMRLFAAALEIRRSGQLRAETLIAFIDAELAHPSRPRVASAVAALAAACEAMEHMADRVEDMRLAIGARACELLAEVVRGEGLGPEEIRLYSSRISSCNAKLTRHTRLAALGLTEFPKRRKIPRFLTSDFTQAFIGASESAREPLADHSMPPHLADKIPQASPEARLRRNDPAVLQSEQTHWRAAAEGVDGETRAGYLAGVAHLVARRVQLGDAAREELEAAFEEARASLSGIADLETRAFALSELAVVFSERHAAGDFARAAKLLEESIELFREAGSKEGLDALQYLARATRYRQDIPRAEAVKRAIVMYQEAADRYHARGAAGGYMICLLNLAEALAMQEDRPRATAIKEAIAVDRVAIEIARLRGDRANLGLLLGNVAWSLTQLAEDPLVPMEEREHHWEEAGPLFEEAEKLTDDPVRRTSLQNHHLCWEEMRIASPYDQIRGRRRHLDGIDRGTQSHAWSFAAHNLAEALIYPSASAAEIREALTLYREALALRPIDAMPELHWECAHQIGALLGGRRYPGQLPALRELGITPEGAYREARDMLRAAIRAGRILGTGRALVMAARTLGLVAAEPPGHLPIDTASAYEALEILGEVLSLAPDDARAADAEADVARALVTGIAKQRATGAPRVGGHALLEGSSAWDLVHLLLRARGGRHRRLRMRLSRPEGVDPATWTRWRLVLREQGNFTERREVAAELRKQAPSFLAASPSLEGTLQWLREGRAAASLVLTERTLLVIVLGNGPGGPSARVLAVDLERCPVAESGAGAVFRSATDRRSADHKTAQDRVRELHEWLVNKVVAPLKLVLPLGTTELCWSPNGIAAWMPLEVLWPDGPRVWTTPCLTRPPPPESAAAGDGVLLVCADPRSPGERGALLDAASDVADFADAFASTTRIEMLAACGRMYGKALLPTAPAGLVTDRPASPEEVMARVQGRGLILILAHGAYQPDDPAKSTFMLVDADGQEAELTAQQISERPGLIGEAVVVLLSCESGASGRLDAGPAGLAGALLSAGARVVVAPLWPVLLSTAIRVGRAAVEHLANRRPITNIPDAIRTARQELDAKGGRDDVLHGPYVVWCG